MAHQKQEVTIDEFPQFEEIAIENIEVEEAPKIDELNIEDLYVVNNILSNAVKCTSLNKSENIYIKDENLISNLKKGTIIKKAENNFLIDTEKTVELKEKLLNMKF